MDHSTFICSNCEAVHPLTETFSMNGKYICEECLQAYAHICKSCGNRVWDADTVSDGNIVICRSCYDSLYTHCCECDRLILSESAYYDDRWSLSEWACAYGGGWLKCASCLELLIMGTYFSAWEEQDSCGFITGMWSTQHGCDWHCLQFQEQYSRL